MRTVKFDGKDSYSHFGLIRSGAEIGTPEVRKSTVEVEGMDGVLDFTEYFGEPIYENREINFEFQVPPQEPWENVMAATDIPTESEFIDGGKGGITVYGNTRQNLWVNPATRTSNGITLTKNAYGTVTVSGTATADTWIFFDRIYTVKPNVEYTLSVDKLVANSGADVVYGFYVEERTSTGASIGTFLSVGKNDTEYTRTMHSNTASAFCGFRAYEGCTVSGTYRVMLNEGSTSEPWCPPGIHGVEELALTTTGKNLAAKFSSATQNGVTMTVGEDGAFDARGNYSSYTASNIKYPTWFEKGDTYTASFTVDEAVSGLNAFLYFSWRKPGNVFYGSANVNVGKSLTFTIPKDADSVYMCMYFGKSNDSYPVSVDLRGCRIQIERGTEATSYEPPQITQTPIDLQGHTLHSLPDGTRDELHVDSSGAVGIESETVVTVLDGQTNKVYASSTGVPGFFVTNIAYPGGIENSELPNLWCDSLPRQTRGNQGTSSYMQNGISANASSVTIRLIDFGTADEANEWLKAHPVTVVSPASRQTVELGTIEMEQFDRSFHALFSKLKNAIHGKKCKIELSDDPAFFYTGRCEVDEWQTNERIGSIAVTCDCEPYKARQNVTEVSVALTGTAKTVTFRNLRKRVVPVFDTGGASITIKQGTKTFTAQGSSWSSADLMFGQGENELTFTGTGTVNVSYQERGL